MESKKRIPSDNKTEAIARFITTAIFSIIGAILILDGLSGAYRAIDDENILATFGRTFEIMFGFAVIDATIRTHSEFDRGR